MENLTITDVFDESDRRKCLQKFDNLIRQLSKPDHGHDINQIVTMITENLIRLSANGDLKFERTLYSLPWAKFLFAHDDRNNTESTTLRNELFAQLLVEYVQIFPNKSDKFIDNFLFILRGDKDAASRCNEPSTITPQEAQLFAHLKTTISSLLKSVGNFEHNLTASLKKWYPFYQNSSVHEFVCYTYNLLQISESLSNERTFEIFDFLCSKILQIDMPQFFDELNDVNKENVIFEFEDLHSCATAAMAPSGVPIRDDERVKKCQVLDMTFKLLFDYIDHKLAEDDATQQAMLEILTTICFQRLLIADSMHVQYLIFQLCAKSRRYCDTLVNDLWTIATNVGDSLQIREGAFSLLVSLFRNANFVPINTIFSFLKVIIQWLNAYLDLRTSAPDNMTIGTSSSSSSSSDNDVMYHNICNGFCELFAAFHADLERIQIECLKNLNMKRAVMNTQYAPMQYFAAELRHNFALLATHYRIGYANLHEIRQRSLSLLSATHNGNPPRFGRIKLPCVRSRIVPYLREIASIDDNDDYHRNMATAAAVQISPTSPTFSTVLVRSPKASISHQFGANVSREYYPHGRQRSFAASPLPIAIASAASNTSDDAMALSSPGSFQSTSGNLIMAHMLSDMEYGSP